MNRESETAGNEAVAIDWNETGSKELIRSVSYDQDEILRWILMLYVPSGLFDADGTYSVGGFYKRIPKPRLRFDICPQGGDVIQADCRSLPLEAASLNSLVLDPPFLATKGPSLGSRRGNLMARRFTVLPDEKALTALYRGAVAEACRVLLPGGVLVFKCQDKVSSGKQCMTHCDVYNMAVENGFEALDLFVLIAKSRLVAGWQRRQKHARKFHSFFWVFRKRRA